jgi:hypothetical protein
MHAHSQRQSRSSARCCADPERPQGPLPQTASPPRRPPARTQAVTWSYPSRSPARPVPRRAVGAAQRARSGAPLQSPWRTQRRTPDSETSAVSKRAWRGQSAWDPTLWHGLAPSDARPAASQVPAPPSWPRRLRWCASVCAYLAQLARGDEAALQRGLLVLKKRDILLQINLL